METFYRIETKGCNPQMPSVGYGVYHCGVYLDNPKTGYREDVATLLLSNGTHSSNHPLPTDCPILLEHSTSDCVFGFSSLVQLRQWFDADFSMLTYVSDNSDIVVSEYLAESPVHSDKQSICHYKSLSFVKQYRLDEI